MIDRTGSIESVHHIQAQRTTMLTTRSLSTISLSDSNDTMRDLGTYWKEQPIVLVFIRHFG